LKNIILIIALLFLSACAELNLVNHLSKKIINSTETIKDKEKNYENKNIVKPYYKVGNPYSINGIKYIPKEDPNYFEEGIASWYGPKFDGKLTANGEIFDQYAVTAAHKTLPIPSLVKVTNLENNRNIVLRINDRGPFVGNRIIDLSYKSAQLLGIIEKGTGKVRVEIIDYGEHLLINNSKKSVNKNINIDKEFFLQVGVFKDANNADKLSNRLRHIDYINYKVSTKTSNLNESFLYTVRIGPIIDNENTMYVQRKLKKDEINTKVIIE
jgi:rare lipoprotein A (peptidoglycan hydrolase)